MLGARLIHGAVWENRAAGIISAPGPSRHFACTEQSGRFWREADIHRQAEPAGLVANDPEPTSAGSKFCNAAGSCGLQN